MFRNLHLGIWKSNVYFKILLTCITLILCMYAMLSFGYTIPVVLMLIVLWLLIISKPIVGIMLLMFSIYFLPGIAQLFDLPYNQDRVIWFLTVNFLFISMIINIKSTIKLNSVDKAIFAYFTAIIFSAILGENPMVVSVKMIITYLQFPFLYIFVKNLPLSIKSQHKISYWIRLVIFIQIPVVILQRSILSDKYLSGDLFTGLLGKGSTGHLAVLMSFGFSFIFASILLRKNISRNGLLLLTLTIPVVIGSGKFGHILFLLISISMIVISRRLVSVKETIKILVIVATFFSSISVLLYYVNPRMNVREYRTIELLTNPESMLKESLVVSNSGYAVGKLARIIITYQYIKDDVKSLLLGFGPGTLSKSVTFKEQGNMSKVLMARVGPSVGVSVMLADLGFIGFLT